MSKLNYALNILQLQVIKHSFYEQLNEPRPQLKFNCQGSHKASVEEFWAYAQRLTLPGTNPMNEMLTSKDIFFSKLLATMLLQLNFYTKHY